MRSLGSRSHYARYVSKCFSRIGLILANVTLPRSGPNPPNPRSKMLEPYTQHDARSRFGSQLKANAGHGNRWNAGAAPPL